MKVLFLDACIRGEESRTKQLCQAALEEIQTLWKDAEITHLDLNAMDLLPINRERLNRRDGLEKRKVYDDPIFDLAHQLAAADLVLIGAPYWEASFPSMLRVYVEHVSVVNITFGHTPEGLPVGLCRADRMLFITTAGGPIEDKNFGFQFLDNLFHLFGVDKTECHAAEGLDIQGADVEGILRTSEEKLRRAIRAWGEA